MKKKLSNMSQCLILGNIAVYFCILLPLFSNLSLIFTLLTHPVMLFPYAISMLSAIWILKYNYDV